MADLVQMLALSPTMEEGRLVRWTKAEGDDIEEGEVIAEIETDKATMEMESFFEGKILKLMVEEGSDVPVGSVIAVIGEEGEDISAALAGGNAPAAEEAPAKEAPAPAAAQETAAAPAPVAADGERVFSSPVARKMAQAHDLDLGSIAGSGPRGRVIKRDVEAIIASAAVQEAAAQASAPKTTTISVSASAPPLFEGSERVDLTPMRKTIAARMSESWVSAPLFALTTEVDMDAVMGLRKSINQALADADAGMKVSVNDMIIKACAIALTKVPGMNVAWGGDHIVTHKEVHIGVAVALDGGLITPVVRHANTKGLGAISQEVRDLAGRAREKRLKPDEYTGSTFSISNLGMFGITKFQAVINPPEAGILAVGSVVKKPVVNGAGEIVVGQRMEMTLSCDHRSTDGAAGAVFLKEVRRLLENPVLLTV